MLKEWRQKRLVTEARERTRSSPWRWIHRRVLHRFPTLSSSLITSKHNYLQLSKLPRRIEFIQAHQFGSINRNLPSEQASATAYGPAEFDNQSSPSANLREEIVNKWDDKWCKRWLPKGRTEDKIIWKTSDSPYHIIGGDLKKMKLPWWRLHGNLSLKLPGNADSTNYSLQQGIAASTDEIKYEKAHSVVPWKL